MTREDMVFVACVCFGVAVLLILVSVWNDRKNR